MKQAGQYRAEGATLRRGQFSPWNQWLGRWVRSINDTGSGILVYIEEFPLPEVYQRLFHPDLRCPGIVVSTSHLQMRRETPFPTSDLALFEYYSSTHWVFCSNCLPRWVKYVLNEPVLGIPLDRYRTPQVHVMFNILEFRSVIKSVR